MAETTLQLGFVPKNRGEYQSTPVTRYYKDNVVQYNGSSYIADPVGWSEDHPTDTYVTIAPTDESGNLNTGWRVFASGNNTFTTGEKVDNIGIDSEPTAGSNNLVKSGGVFNTVTNVVNSERERAELSEQNLQDNIDNIKDETLQENRQMVNSIMEDYAPLEIEGDVNNAADEEDLTSVNVKGTDVLKFKDKVYNPLVYSGLGRKIIRKNIVDGVNILTQEMMSDANTIYIIQYDFTLGENITVPANCVLEFDGGSLSNGTLIGNNTDIQANYYHIFKNISFSGSWLKKEIVPQWFGCKTASSLADFTFDNTEYFQKAINSGFNVYVPAGFYYINNTIFINNQLNIRLEKDNIRNVDSPFFDGNINSIIFSRTCNKLFDIRNVVSWEGGIIYTGNIENISNIVFNFNFSYQNWGTTIDTLIYGNNDKVKGINTTAYYMDVENDERPSVHGYVTLLKLKGKIYNCDYGINVPAILQNSVRWYTDFELMFDSFGCRRIHYILGGDHLKIGGIHQARYILTQEEHTIGDNKLTNIYPTFVYKSRRIIINSEYWDYSKETAVGGYYVHKIVVCTVKGDTNTMFCHFGSFVSDQIYNLHCDIDSNMVDIVSQNINIGYHNIYHRTEDGKILKYPKLITEAPNGDAENNNNLFFYGNNIVTSPSLRLGICIDGKVIDYDGIDRTVRRYGTQSQAPDVATTPRYMMYYDMTNNMPVFNTISNGNRFWMDATGVEIGTKRSGTSSERPTYKQKYTGFVFFDTNCNKPIYWNGTNWVDATGVLIGTSTNGTFANKPTVSNNAIPIGFKYFCTDKQTPEGATNGIEIIHKGNDIWVDALGRVVS